jgi:hypothetical protein
VPVPPLTAEQTSHDVIVGGIFSGSVRKPGSWATPSGTLEVGYQVGCDHPNGMMFFMIDQFKHGQNDVSISQQKFTGADPKVEISGYRLHIDRCPGEAFIRSYAILTREGDQSGSVVYYYGVPKIV